MVIPPSPCRIKAITIWDEGWADAHRLCGSRWFMAFRLAVAISSLWPPDRKLIPVEHRKHRRGQAVPWKAPLK